MKLLAIYVMAFFSCTGGTAKKEIPAVTSEGIEAESNTKKVLPKNVQNDGEAAKKWLVNTIEFYFDDEKDSDMSLITTKIYHEYKSDATGIFYDGGLSEEAFETKWQGIFNTEYAGLGNGFLISAQDWINVKVASCTLASSSTDAYFFKVTITEASSGEHYQRDIKVVPHSDSFLIADVKEYDQ